MKTWALFAARLFTSIEAQNFAGRAHYLKRDERRMTQSLSWWRDRWRTMFLIRSAEEAIAQMVQSGEARCPCHLCIGQEAVAAGVCSVLTPQDTVWGGHRSHGHYLA